MSASKRAFATKSHRLPVTLPGYHLKVKANMLGKTLYQTKHDLLSDSLRAESESPVYFAMGFSVFVAMAQSANRSPR